MLSREGHLEISRWCSHRIREQQ